MGEPKFKQDSHETRIALLEQSILHIHEAIERIEKSMIDGFSQLNMRIDKLDSRMWTNFLWLMATMLSLAGSGYYLIGKGFHWFN